MADTRLNSSRPYRNDALNTLYELLFCDQIGLYKNKMEQPADYPWNILFSERATTTELQGVADDDALETRAKLLACHRLKERGERPARRALHAVIVEVGLEDGLDVLASYHDGTARYINQSEKVLIWETATPDSNALTNNLFSDSIAIVSRIGPWEGARRPHPAEGTVRISFLVSDGLYFGEGPIPVLFNDPVAKPALQSATELMQYLTERSLVAP
ncbi:hypothetical protein ACFPMF_20715 [Larkinella bovis]|uniref:Uncharacterized protein n=1 Tax=Larkinella bovis TaxID=683041 RepID=A0ABW0IKT2_9BACT